MNNRTQSEAVGASKARVGGTAMKFEAQNNNYGPISPEANLFINQSSDSEQQIETDQVKAHD